MDSVHDTAQASVGGSWSSVVWEDAILLFSSKSFSGLKGLVGGYCMMVC